MFKNSCFISYRHFKGDETSEKFIRLLYKSLFSELIPRVKAEIFLDETKMTGGDILSQRLSTELCHSCCMIMVFVPVYFDEDSIYCTREFLSMLKLEDARKKHSTSGKGLVIPVIYKETKFFEKSALKDRLYFDFENFGLWGPETLKTRDMKKKIRELADYITERFRELNNNHNLCKYCNDHSLVSEEEATNWLKNTWFSSFKSGPADFPFRSNC